MQTNSRPIDVGAAVMRRYLHNDEKLTRRQIYRISCGLSLAMGGNSSGIDKGNTPDSAKALHLRR